MGRTFGRVMAANFSCLVGALGGIKAADMVGWDGNKYEAMKERLEIDYWKKYGRPKHIEGNLHKSAINEGEYYVTYLKEKNPHESLEKRRYDVL